MMEVSWDVGAGEDKGIVAQFVVDHGEVFAVIVWNGRVVTYPIDDLTFIRWTN